MAEPFRLANPFRRIVAVRIGTTITLNAVTPVTLLGGTLYGSYLFQAAGGTFSPGAYKGKALVHLLSGTSPAGNTIVGIDGLPPPDFFTRVKFHETTLLAADAAFSYDGAIGVWTWPTTALIGTGVYKVRFSRSAP